MSDHLAERGRAVLRAAGRSTPFCRGEHLITAGDDSDEILLVESGLVKVVLVAPDGAESVVGVLGPRVLLGESGVLGRRPRTAHVLALMSGRAVHLAGSTFLRLLAEHTAVRGLVDQTWRDRQQDADDRQLGQTRDVPTRVGLALLKWARAVGTPTGSGLQVRGLSQRDIARAVAASDKSVEAAFSALRAAGHLTTSRLAYVLTRPDDLEQRLTGPNRRTTG